MNRNRSLKALLSGALALATLAGAAWTASAQDGTGTKDQTRIHERIQDRIRTSQSLNDAERAQMQANVEACVRAGVTDPGLRQQLRDARGPCHRHAWRMARRIIPRRPGRPMAGGSPSSRSATATRRSMSWTPSASRALSPPPRSTWAPWPGRTWSRCRSGWSPPRRPPPRRRQAPSHRLQPALRLLRQPLHLPWNRNSIFSRGWHTRLRTTTLTQI